MTMEGLRAYLAACRQWERADCLVVGHSAPDGDAVISSLFEGWRRYLAAGQRAVPVVQAPSLPREVAWLLGDVATDLLTEEALCRFKDTPLVLTDHHTARGRQVIAVVDHHPPAQGAVLPDDTMIRPVGAATTLVAAACRRQGLVPDSGAARLLLGGILLDTDGLSPTKAKAEDCEQATWLAVLAGEDPAQLHDALRGELLAEEDVPTLYRRDYRAFADENGVLRLGFAILKVWEDAAPDTAAVRRLLQEDAAARGVPCVAKISLYGREGGLTERYLAAGDEEATKRLLSKVAACGGPLAQKVAPDEVLLPLQAVHRGRKHLASLLLASLAQRTE